MAGTVKLAFVGDVMLGRGVNRELPFRTPEAFWGSTRSVLLSADAVIANLECAITEETTRWQETPKVFYFRADLAAVDMLRSGNIRCVSLANNHTLDFGERGLLDSLDRLDAAGIQRAGAGRNLAEARKPAVFDVGGIKLGLISLTDNEPSFAAGHDRPGTNHHQLRAEPEALAIVEQAVAECWKRGAGLIILSLHWGPNMVLHPTDAFREFAHAAVDLGVDIIHGHSAHVFQGVEIYKDRPILYSTGDFLDDYAVDPTLRNDWSFIFLVEAAADEVSRITGLRMIPVLLTYAQVDLASDEEFEAIRDRMRQLCAEFGAEVRDIPEGLRVAIG